MKTANAYGNGGYIMGFGANQTGANGAATMDRLLFMNNAGKILFGVLTTTSVQRNITSAAKYNDGNWHHVVGTYAGNVANGLILYVDGAQVAIRAAATNNLAYTGYWRVGFDDVSGSGWGTPNNNQITGTIDDASVYNAVLTPAQIQARYWAGTRNCQSATTFANGTRYFVGGIYDGTNATLYVNGSPECSVAYGTVFQPAATNLTLGASSTGTQNWQGDMATFQFYSTGSGATLNSIYTATLPRM